MEEREKISFERMHFDKLVFNPKTLENGFQYKYESTVYFSEPDDRKGKITGLLLVRDPETEENIFEVEKSLVFYIEDKNYKFSEDNKKEQELAEILFTDISNEVYRLSKEGYSIPMVIKWHEYFEGQNK